MITREQFIEVIEALKSASNFLDRVHDLGMDLYDIEPLESLYKLEKVIFESNFDEDTVDIIYWWLYELDDPSTPSMWDKDGKVIPLDTVDDLWNYCKEHLL